jgi:hypothetical protein
LFTTTYANKKEFPMDGIVERIPQVLQEIFGNVADRVARTCGFIQRERGFSGSDFIRTLVFGWLQRPGASIESLGDELGISGSGLQQRLTDLAVEFVRQVLMQAVQTLLAGRRARIPLLSRFTEVCVEDCSTISLSPEAADEFPGCGGNDEESGKAALRLFACYELKMGRLRQLAIAQARGSDTVVARAHAPDLPSGSLRIRDMGFFDRELLEQDTAKGIYWISRVPAGVTVQPTLGSAIPVGEFLKQQPASVNKLDCWLWVGQADRNAQPLRCRFMAVRCPPEMVQRRRQKVYETARRKGRTPSQKQLEMCNWTVLITNVPEDLLSVEEAWELYCSRWQIELLFKRWKGLGGIQVSTKMKRGRILCELYAKLLGMLVAHWFTLIRGGPLEGFSLTKAIRKIQNVAWRLADALRWPERLVELVAEIAVWMHRIPKQPRRKKKPSTRQRLFHPRLIT